MDLTECIAYHATTSDRVESIQRNNFAVSTRKASWLGEGIYCFFEGPQHANYWANVTAERRSQRLGYKIDGVIFKVRVDLTHSINLLDRGYWPLLAKAYHNVPASCTQVGPGYRHTSNPIPSNVGWNYRDFYAVNSFIGALEEEGIVCDVVIAAFSEGQPIDPTSWLFDETSVTLSVRRNSAITVMDVYQV